MYKLLAVIFKEILLLSRDRAGIIVLFVMPAILVTVISLVQENVLKTTIRVLYVNHDRGFLGNNIKKMLAGSPSVELIEAIDGMKPDTEKARQAVSRGRVQFCVIIPADITDSLEKRVVRVMNASFLPDHDLKGFEGSRVQGATLEPSNPRILKPFKKNNAPDMTEITVYFDPVVQGAFRTAVTHALGRVITAAETGIKIREMARMLPAKMAEQIKAETGMDMAEDFNKLFQDLDLARISAPAIAVKEKVAARGGFADMPTSVQQNVPAYALFGMFFIVVPIAGSLIRERQDGTMTRLLTLPVSYLTLLTGRLMAYAAVCVVQFGVIVFMGKKILPLLGTPVLDMGTDPAAVGAVAFSAILAAAGYGIMLGTLLRTYEQAAMFGAVSVVIAAAIGGIMVPVYVMPPVMQQISAVSPLAWGLNAFLDIFVRHGGLETVFPDIIRLLGFAVITLLISWIFFFRRAGKGG